MNTQKLLNIALDGIDTLAIAWTNTASPARLTATTLRPFWQPSRNTLRASGTAFRPKWIVAVRRLNT
ncbi:hypothetical protein [Marinobacter similis]|uniref:Uncharacterized protein n=1 Tax=Marinobacter similis TaxID=1420916 RepID=W5YUQ8_9GAMM|nr:hypothetical protein [Marinobacter similis]AHI30228.1 hypothetical protein AU14_15910 [Marinobacter similis]